MSFKFEYLHVWQRSIALATDLMARSNAFPKPYQYSIGNQLRRAILSVPTNIAEGSGRGGTNDQSNFYRIAKGSIYEVVSLLVVAKNLTLISADEYETHYQEINEISAMLSGLIKKNRRQDR